MDGQNWKMWQTRDNHNSVEVIITPLVNRETQKGGCHNCFYHQSPPWFSKVVIKRDKVATRVVLQDSKVWFQSDTGKGLRRGRDQCRQPRPAGLSWDCLKACWDQVASCFSGRLSCICLEMDSGLQRPSLDVQGLLTCPVWWDRFQLLQPKDKGQILGRMKSTSCTFNQCQHAN